MMRLAAAAEAFLPAASLHSGGGVVPPRRHCCRHTRGYSPRLKAGRLKMIIVMIMIDLPETYY